MLFAIKQDLNWFFQTNQTMPLKTYEVKQSAYASKKLIWENLSVERSFWVNILRKRISRKGGSFAFKVCLTLS